jgi:4-amino-4-deoxy-L-arabinose transferase-like glycosyltransferase
MEAMRRIWKRMAPWGGFPVAILFGLLGWAHLNDPQATLIPLTGDSQSYLRTASGVAETLERPGWTLERLLHGGFSPEERRELGFDGWILQHAPLYIFPLGVAKAVGAGERGTRVVTVLFLALLGGLLYDLGRRLFSPWVGLLACALLLLQPATLRYGTAVLTEIPLAFLAVLGGWLLVRWRQRMTPGRSLALGLGLGLLYLGKVTWRPLLPLLVLVAVAYLWRREDRTRLLAWLGCGLAAVLVPWWVGLALAGLPANPISETGEDMLWLYRGNMVRLQGWETVGVGDTFTPELVEATREESPRPDRSVRRAYRKALIRTILGDPLGWLCLVGRKFVLFWSHPPVKTYTWTPLGRMPPWLDLFWILVLLALGGWLGVLGDQGRWLAALPALYLGFAHAVSHLVSRYNVPAAPLVHLYAASLPWTLARLPWRGMDGRRALRSRPVLWALLALAAAGALGWWPWPLSGGGYLALSWLRALLVAAALGLGGWALARGWRRLFPEGRGGAWGMAGVGLFLGLLVVAWRGGDPDPDAFSVRLEKPGDQVIQRIGLPRTLDPMGMAGAYLEMDLLRSVSGEFTLEVWVNQRLAHVFVGSLGGRKESFVLNPKIFGQEDRHLRIAETLEEWAKGYLEPRYGPGVRAMDLFRRWVRVPLDPVDLAGRDTLEVRLLLRRAGRGAYVELFGDAALPPRAPRIFRGPVFLTNAYTLSNYKFRLLAGDRREADYRLVMPIPLESPWGESLFLPRGRAQRDLSRAPGFQPGEYRIRLRVRLPGAYVWRVKKGRPRLVWSAERRPEDRTPTMEDVRKRMARLDEAFDGYLTF